MAFDKAKARVHGKALFGTASGVAAAVSFIALYNGDEWTERNIAVASVHGAYWFLIIYLLWNVLRKSPPEFLSNPRVVAVKDDRIILVKNAPWLSLGLRTAIYLKEQEYERLSAEGEVTNVQQNGLAQITLHAHSDMFRDMSDLASTVEKYDRNLILIRPGLYRGL